jgi:hypothetical protein
VQRLNDQLREVVDRQDDLDQPMALGTHQPDDATDSREPLGPLAATGLSRRDDLRDGWDLQESLP